MTGKYAFENALIVFKTRKNRLFFYKKMLCVGMMLLLGGVCMTPVTAQTPAASQPAATTTAPVATGPVELSAKSVNIQLTTSPSEKEKVTSMTFTGRFTSEDLKPLLLQQVQLMPLPLQFQSAQAAMIDAMDRVSMRAVLEKLGPYLEKDFAGRFDLKSDLIVVPVPENKRVERKAAELPEGGYRGPIEDVSGFMIHEINQQDYIRLAVLIMQTARQLIDVGHPIADRKHPDYYALVADQEVAKIIELEKARRAQEMSQKAIRCKIGEGLGIYDPIRDTFQGDPNWVQESRKFAFVVKNGEFIDRIKGLVEQINKEMEIAGFHPPETLFKEGIHFDPDLNEVLIVLPGPIMKSFLQEADLLERRMAEDHLISIEAVRITDREIIDGALASRLNASFQGVHNVRDNDNDWLRKQVGINSLLAVANHELDVMNRRQIVAGNIPDGTLPPMIGGVGIPAPLVSREHTNIGGNLSVGADDIFFDGREQNYGFSYIGPDGRAHTLSLDVVDSLQEYWNRIERNLIVHKIKKTIKPTIFTVPVGPETKTFEGIAALISQENRNVVVSQEGSLVQLSATAGTWLVIQDFQIEPTPGSSTSLTDEETQRIEDRVLLTMFLRDPTMDVVKKCELVEAQNITVLHDKLRDLYEKYQARCVRAGQGARTYESIFEHRRRQSVDDASIEKKEENSQIRLTFYSSQGNITQQLGLTALGDSNDLTSFTTELRPNVVTPISSFFTKSANGTEESSPMTGASKGEKKYEEKTMAHLVIRARFPNLQRERSDLEEGRYLGYFDLPLGKTPYSDVDMPFLSSSDHPLTRLSKYRFGLMFPALQAERVKRPWSRTQPNVLSGDVLPNAWETATTRMMMNRKIITDTPGSEQDLEAQYRERFKVEVRSLLEYDDDFFAAPKVALRNMDQWNNPDRIVYALKNSTNQFALTRLMSMIDELGNKLISDEYAEEYLAASHTDFWGSHRIKPLSDKQLLGVRRDVANHYLRIMEVYGDAFHEAVSNLFDLNSYRQTKYEDLVQGPLNGYREMVIFDRTSYSDPEMQKVAHEEFMMLKQGGYKGRLFQRSLMSIEDMNKDYQKYVIRGTQIVDRQSGIPQEQRFW
jgi:hypothetical protein